jgi:hypothetical protein
MSGLARNVLNVRSDIYPAEVSAAITFAYEVYTDKTASQTYKDLMAGIAIGAVGKRAKLLGSANGLQAALEEQCDETDLDEIPNLNKLQIMALEQRMDDKATSYREKHFVENIISYEVIY